jgi:hypothetical protein
MPMCQRAVTERRLPGRDWNKATHLLFVPAAATVNPLCRANQWLTGSFFTLIGRPSECWLAFWPHLSQCFFT